MYMSALYTAIEMAPMANVVVDVHAVWSSTCCYDTSCWLDQVIYSTYLSFERKGVGRLTGLDLKSTHFADLTPRFQKSPVVKADRNLSLPSHAEQKSQLFDLSSTLLRN